MTRLDAGRLALLVTGLAVASQLQADSGQMDPVRRGTAHYLFFCANCHGVNGQGDGPLAALLKIAPSDLTVLRASGHGESVAERVMKAVDGRHKVGEADEHKMPVFSENLEMKTVIEITEYLKTIQK